MSNTRAREVAGLAAVEAQRPRGHHGRISAHLDYGKGINVCLWLLADINVRAEHVRFRGQSGHSQIAIQCPLMTQSGHVAYYCLASRLA